MRHLDAADDARKTDQNLTHCVAVVDDLRFTAVLRTPRNSRRLTLLQEAASYLLKRVL
jgi:hypothetical protein